MVNRHQQGCEKPDTILEAMAASDEPRGANRRQHARVPGPFDGYRISVLPIPVQIYDLSPGGCFVNSLNEQKPGSASSSTSSCRARAGANSPAKRCTASRISATRSASSTYRPNWRIGSKRRCGGSTTNKSLAY